MTPSSRVSDSAWDRIFILTKNLAPRKSAADGFQGVIISLGPHTDAALDQFGLDDSLVPRLRILTRTIRDTQWERTLRTTEWGLSYEQAVNLVKAMKRDIKAQQVQPVQVSP
jgi:hypothetical protein